MCFIPLSFGILCYTLKDNKNNCFSILIARIFIDVPINMSSPGGSVDKESPAMQEMQETRVRSLSQEDPMEEGMATPSSILAWRIQRIADPSGLQSLGSQTVGHD